MNALERELYALAKRDRDRAEELRDKAERERDEALAEVARLRETWICFHCGFQTSDQDEARAHFGDCSDEPYPLCVAWQEMPDKDRAIEYQSIVRELSAERDENDVLRRKVEEISNNADLEERKRKRWELRAESARAEVARLKRKADAFDALCQLEGISTEEAFEFIKLRRAAS